jgi:hypothetical protein
MQAVNQLKSRFATIEQHSPKPNMTPRDTRAITRLPTTHYPPRVAIGYAPERPLGVAPADDDSRSAGSSNGGKAAAAASSLRWSVPRAGARHRSTLEFADYTEEEVRSRFRFGGDPEKMAAAAQIVESDRHRRRQHGLPGSKIAKHNAGCSPMREPAHAASVIAAM